MNVIMPTALSFIFMFLLGVVGFVIVASFIVDVKLSNVYTRITNSHNRRLKKLALIIYTKNNASEILSCLEAVRTARTPTTEIIIVDNASKDETVQNIKVYKKTHPTFQCTTLFKRVPTSKSAALRQASYKVTRGELILTATTRAVISKNLLTQVRQVGGAQELTCLPMALPSIGKILPNYLLLAQSYFELSRYLFKKALSVIGSSSKAPHECVLYRGVQSLRSGEPVRYIKESYLLTVTSRSPSSYISYSWSGVLVAVSLLFLVSYFTYLAVSKEVSVPLFYSFWLLIVWLSVAIVSASELSRREKGLACFVLPLAYPLLFVVGLGSVAKNIIKKIHTYHNSFNLAKRL